MSLCALLNFQAVIGVGRKGQFTPSESEEETETHILFFSHHTKRKWFDLISLYTAYFQNEFSFSFAQCKQSLTKGDEPRSTA